MTELARKVLLTGLGAVLMTEAGIRKSLGDVKIPKEGIASVIDAMRKQKDDVLSLFAAELANFFAKIKVHEEVRKALSGLQIHLDAKVTFSNSRDHAEVQPKLSVKRLKRG